MATGPAVRRLTPAGAVDPGWALPAGSGGLTGKLAAVAPVGDGRVFVATTQALALLRADGSLDPSFGGTGLVPAPRTSSTDYVLFAGAAVLDDGSVVVLCQHALNATGGQVAEARRYRADGTPDPAYGGGDGVATLTAIRSAAYIGRAHAAPGGRVLIDGYGTGPAAGEGVLVRLTAGGDPDPTFDGDGFWRADQVGADLLNAVRVDGQGRIVLATAREQNPLEGTRLVRLNADGSPDPAFGTDGVAGRMLPAPWVYWYWSGLVLLPDGSAVVAQTGFPTADTPRDLAVVRFSPTGVRDAGFGDGGVVRRDGQAARPARPATPALAPDGRLVVPASLSPGGGPAAVLRFNPDGTPDAGIGPGGVRLFSPGGAETVFVTAAAVDPSGKTVVVGWGSRIDFERGGSSPAATYVGRLNADGTPDPTFGGDGSGFAVVPPSVAAEYPGGVVALADGRIVVVAGGTNRPDGSRIMLVKCYLPDGRLDPAFGDNGRYDLRSATARPVEGATLHLAPDGNLLVTAAYAIPTGASPAYGQVAIALTPQGRLADGYAGGGVIDVSTGWRAWAAAPSYLDPAGNLYLFGTDNDLLRAFRLTPGGGVDTSFGNAAHGMPGLLEGRVIRTGTTGFVTHFVATADGKVVGAGRRTRTVSGQTVSDYLAVRLLPSGQPDTGFGPNGERVVDRGGSERFTWAGVRPDGRVVLVGSATAADGRPAITATQLQGERPTPGVAAVTVHDGRAQRSVVASVTVTFDRPVVVDPDAFAVVGRGGAGVGTSVAAANPSGDARTWVLTFAGPGVVGGSLPDGVYDLTVAGAKVRGGFATGPAMAADHTLAFHRLFGDANGSKSVNNADYLLFRNAFGTSAGGAGYDPAFDLDGNGLVNNADYLQFRSRFGTAFAY